MKVQYEKTRNLDIYKNISPMDMYYNKQNDKSVTMINNNLKELNQFKLSKLSINSSILDSVYQPINYTVLQNNFNQI